MLKTMAGLWLKNGGSSYEYIAIEKKDMDTILQSFDRNSAESLQNEVIFSLIYFLGARGREEFRRLKRSDICFDQDSEDGRYAYIKTEKADNTRKNVKASLKKKEYSSKKMNRIYDQNCVKCLELYLDLIQRDVPNSEVLFPKPLRKLRGSQMFSEKLVRGEHFLGNFMKNLSTNLKLSKSYTNHCVRCTMITNAKESGLTNDEVCLITGHKDQRTIDKYVRPSENHRRKLSSCVSLQKKASNAEISIMVDKKEDEIVFQSSRSKSMKIEVDGETNRITFAFE